jgi:hypothetical protein
LYGGNAFVHFRRPITQVLRIRGEVLGQALLRLAPYAWGTTPGDPRDADRCQGDACPTRVAADSEPKRNKERTTVGANSPRLCSRKSCLGLGLVHKEARS